MTGDMRRRDRAHRAMHRRQDARHCKDTLHTLTLRRLPFVWVTPNVLDAADWWLTVAAWLEAALW